MVVGSPGLPHHLVVPKMCQTHESFQDAAATHSHSLSRSHSRGGGEQIRNRSVGRAAILPHHPQLADRAVLLAHSRSLWRDHRRRPRVLTRAVRHLRCPRCPWLAATAFASRDTAATHARRRARPAAAHIPAAAAAPGGSTAVRAFVPGLHAPIKVILRNLSLAL